jgi:hypothetical protein
VALCAPGCVNPQKDPAANRNELTNKNYAENLTIYHTIDEVVQDKYLTFWAESTPKSISSVLHFNLSGPDKLSVELTPECWAEFPIKVISRKVVVYWDVDLDTKTPLPLIRAIRQTSKRFRGKPFMVLELGNHNTLLATYPLPELTDKLNKADKSRVVFPDRYLAKRLY